MRHDHAPRGHRGHHAHHAHRGRRGRRAFHGHRDRHGQRGRRDHRDHQRLLGQRPLSPQPSRRRRTRLRQDVLTNLQTQGRSKTTHQPLQPSAQPLVLVDRHAHRHLVQPAL